jgi:hypothetical protein
MRSNLASAFGFELPALLRGETDSLRECSECWNTRRVVVCLGIIVAGTGVFGAAMGAWRGPQQAVYTAIKLPLIILLTTFGNALLNAILAPLLGLNLRFRQSLLAILMSFTITAAILGALSPLTLFLVWNLPPMAEGTRETATAFSLLQLTQVAAIAFAGVAANLRLMQWLRQVAGSAAVAWRVLFAWLAGNLLLGSQLGWILRPFFGSPRLPVEFLRGDAFKGNFFESLLGALRQLFGN